MDSDYDNHLSSNQYDIEYERYNYQISDVIKEFILHFHNAFMENNIPELQNIYENTFPYLSEQYFKSSPWPEVEQISDLVIDDEIFLILYQELYFRHIYARISLGPSIHNRVNSYFNYCKLFNYILSASVPVPLELPDQWLWEIIDEFIYQFQSYSQYRLKGSKKTEEIEIIQDYHKIWNVLSVLNVLHSLVEKSNINRQLEVYTNGGNPDSVAGDFGRHSLYKMLGYFSLMGLLRLHSLFGDYYQAIKVLENVELNKKSHYSKVPACQISTSYYVGFAYLMMRRYSDAIRTFSDILFYIQRTKQLFQAKTFQNDFIGKQTDQMYLLLAVCLVLHPQNIDDSVMSVLREKPYNEMMPRMQRRELTEFEACFSFSCPKFLSAIPSSYDSVLSDYNNDPYQLQLKVFMDEVKQQLYLPTIRSYLKLYTTMPIYKMAAFMEMHEEDFKTQLLCFKHKMKNLVWTKGSSGLEGEFQSDSDLDFYIDKDMIHIADTRVSRKYGDFFIRQINRYGELISSLKNLRV